MLAITGLGWVLYEEALNLPVVGAMTLVIAGVSLINLYSNAHEPPPRTLAYSTRASAKMGLRSGA